MRIFILYSVCCFLCPLWLCFYGWAGQSNGPSMWNVVKVLHFFFCSYLSWRFRGSLKIRGKCLMLEKQVAWENSKARFVFLFFILWKCLTQFCCSSRIALNMGFQNSMFWNFSFEFFVWISGSERNFEKFWIDKQMNFESVTLESRRSRRIFN